MNLHNYIVVTGAYWGFTLTDGALRMLVLLHFFNLGYSPVTLAFLFLLYEFCGILTNLLGGWIASRMGLRVTLVAGLALQVVALVMLALLNPLWSEMLSVTWVMGSQALSGVAKDLTKMSSKSAIKVLVPPDAKGTLFKWVAILTGSKNALKGVGFFLGGFLLTVAGFSGALWIMAGVLVLVWLGAWLTLPRGMGRAKVKAGWRELFAKSRAINVLCVARFFLFGARDIWFVVGVPVFLSGVLGWNFAEIFLRQCMNLLCIDIACHNHGSVVWRIPSLIPSQRIGSGHILQIIHPANDRIFVRVCGIGGCIECLK